MGFHSIKILAFEKSIAAPYFVKSKMNGLIFNGEIYML